jgi:hypothetical protein
VFCLSSAFFLIICLSSALFYRQQGCRLSSAFFTFEIIVYLLPSLYLLFIILFDTLSILCLLYIHFYSVSFCALSIFCLLYTYVFPVVSYYVIPNRLPSAIVFIIWTGTDLKAETLQPFEPLLRKYLLPMQIHTRESQPLADRQRQFVWRSGQSI